MFRVTQIRIFLTFVISFGIFMLIYFSNNYTGLISVSQIQSFCTNIPQNLLNISNFTYLKVSPTICTFKQPSILIIVHSAIKNVIKRDAIRITWGSLKRYKKWTIEIVFMLGFNPNSEIPLNENDDIVVGNFKDSYRNLSYKHLMGYKWAVQFCPSAKYIIKTDDDVFIDIFQLLKVIERTERKIPSFQIIGNLMNGYAPERTDSKAAITLDEYPGDIYPDYVSGLAYVIKSLAACEILKSQNSKPFLWIDDVFVTGVLREPFKFEIKAINYEYFLPGDDTKALVDWIRSEGNFTTPSKWAIMLMDFDFKKYKMTYWEIFGRTWSRILRLYNLHSRLEFIS